MAKYACSICGFVYDEASGIKEDGIAPGTKWEDLPDNWACPVCGAAKSEFEKQGESAPVREEKPKPVIDASSDRQQLSPWRSVRFVQILPGDVKNNIKRNNHPCLNN